VISFSLRERFSRLLQRSSPVISFMLAPVLIRFWMGDLAGRDRNSHCVDMAFCPDAVEGADSAETRLSKKLKVQD